MRKSVGALIASVAPVAALMPSPTQPLISAPPVKRHKARGYNKHLVTRAHRVRIRKLQRIARRRTRCA